MESDMLAEWWSPWKIPVVSPRSGEGTEHDDTQKRQGCRSDIAIYRVSTWQRQSSHVVDHGVPWFSQLPPFLFRSSPATLPRWHRNEPVGGFGSNTWDRSKLTVSAFVPSVCSPEKWCCVKNPNFCHILIRGFPWMVYKDL